jgi:hypothetical protein
MLYKKGDGMKKISKIKSTTCDYLIIIADNVYFALTMIFMILGAVFFCGFTTKFFIVNPHIFKASKIARHKIIVIQKYLNKK